MSKVLCERVNISILFLRVKLIHDTPRLMRFLVTLVFSYQLILPTSTNDCSYLWTVFGFRDFDSFIFASGYDHVRYDGVVSKLQNFTKLTLNSLMTLYLQVVSA